MAFGTKYAVLQDKLKLKELKEEELKLKEENTVFIFKNLLLFKQRTA
jgi:hypothetical protein